MKLYITIFICIIFISCKRENAEIDYERYKNKPNYNINIGDTFMLVFDENSCCINKRLNIATLKSVQLIKDTILVPYPKDCFGCSSYFGLILKGITVGTDTIKFARHGAGLEWKDIEKDTNRYDRQFFMVTVLD